jgi:hypothetical protein
MSVVPNSSSVIAIFFFLRATHLVINSLRFCTWECI